MLVAIVAAIVVGIILDSWIWGVATFFILMFIFIWVASWIFGGPMKGKVEVNDELEELLNKLETIGNIKNEFPFTSRGWCNSLGLFVQLREKGGLLRLEAGDDKCRSQIDAWRDDSLEWKVKKYNPGNWEKLVNPTLDIANWLSTWGGLPEEHMDSFNRAVEVFKKEGHLELPDVKKAGETRKAGIAGGVAKDKAGVKKPSNTTKARTKIEEYDQELREDTERLKKHISKEEKIAKEFMRSYGALEKTTEEVVRKVRNEGSPISLFASNEDILRLQTFLTEMVQVYKAFPFRVWTRQEPFLIPAETNVITKDDWFRFDTRPLDDEERTEYAKQWEATRVLNYTPSQIPVYKWYPTPELMRFVGDMLKKYGANSVLTKDEYRDENMKSA